MSAQCFVYRAQKLHYCEGSKWPGLNEQDLVGILLINEGMSDLELIVVVVGILQIEAGMRLE